MAAKVAATAKVEVASLSRREVRKDLAQAQGYFRTFARESVDSFGTKIAVLSQHFRTHFRTNLWLHFCGHLAARMRSRPVGMLVPAGAKLATGRSRHSPFSSPWSYQAVAGKTETSVPPGFKNASAWLTCLA